MLTLLRQQLDPATVARDSLAPRTGLLRRVADRARWEWNELRAPSRETFIQEELDHALLDEVVWRAGERVLDVGCARGRYMTAVARKGACPLGVDISPQLVAESRTAGHQALVASGERLPVGDATIDTVLCHKTLYLFRQPRAAVREFGRILKPGGRVIFSTSNQASPYSRVQAAKLAGNSLPNWIGGNRWSVTDWCSEFADAGMVTRSIYSCNLIWPLVYRVCDRWLIPNEWMRRYNRWVRRMTGIPLKTTHALGAAQDYLVEVVKRN